MNEILNLLNKDEVTLKLYRKVSPDGLINDCYIEFDGHILKEYGDFVDLENSIVYYLNNLPRLSQSTYTDFLMRSSFSNYFISYTDLAKYGVLIVDKPVFSLSGIEGLVQVIGYIYADSDDISLSDFKYIYSFEESKAVRGIRIRGVKHSML